MLPHAFPMHPPHSTKTTKTSLLALQLLFVHWHLHVGQVHVHAALVLLGNNHSLGGNATLESSSLPMQLTGRACSSRLGQLPGTFLLGQTPGDSFQFLSPTAPRQNLLQRYAVPGGATTIGAPLQRSAEDSTPPGPQLLPTVSILLLGDSVDWRMMAHVCSKFLGGNIQPTSEYPARQQQFTYCNSSSSLKLGAVYLPGVHPTGPYAWGVAEGNDQQRLSAAVKLFRSSLGVHDGPDMVVLAAAFWDLSRICHSDKAPDYEHCKSPMLTPHFLHGWMQNYTSLFRRVQEALLPQSPIMVYHTQVRVTLVRLSCWLEGGWYSHLLGSEWLLPRLYLKLTLTCQSVPCALLMKGQNATC